jgi:transcription antitermination factor NusG
MTITSIIEFRSIQPMREGHSLTELPDGEQPGFRANTAREGDSGLIWYLARVAGRREHKAEAALVEAGMTVYLPRLVCKRRAGPDRNRVEEALFAGYLFVGAANRTIKEMEAANGVYRIVRFQREADPRPLPFALIQDILGQELAGEFDNTRSNRRRDPPEGTAVELVGGKFQGFPARFVRRDPDDRVRLLLRMCGKEHPHVEQPHNVGGLEEAA